ncbi:MAG: c-type cytochrome domain-containing protein, partial [Planctomycetota bacterium]|nr:c-type cytochrome domain-containing protein [Planctomycetota bacterium]
MSRVRMSPAYKLAFAFLLLPILLTEAARAEAPDFERRIAPILITRGLECHTARDAAGKLVLASPPGLSKGGESGDAAVVAGRPDASLLIERIESGEMPPRTRDKLQHLPAEEIKQLRAWIAAGAVWPK